MTPGAGLQPERTSLAWQRSALALVVVGLVLPRFGWAQFGGWSWLAAALVVGGGCLLALLGRRRALASRTSPGVDGRLPLVATLATVLVGLLAAVLLAG